MKINIVVIGGCGYIGSILVPELLRCGYKVYVIDSLRYGQKPFLDICYNKDFSFSNGDIRDLNSFRSIYSSADVIINLAAIVGAEACDKSPFETTSINTGAVKELLRVLSKKQAILYPCTNSGYGIGQRELYCTEESPVRPISLYGRTKVESETMILDRSNSISLRLATVFGSSPCMRTELLVNNFVLKAIKDKFIVLFESHFKRNYIHVRDVVSAFILCLKNYDKMKDNIYNVGLSSANLSKKELCEILRKYIDFTFIDSDYMKDVDQRNYIVSNDKIEKFGFKPQFSIDDGVIELIKAYQINTIPYSW